jgi:hypothetical protein
MESANPIMNMTVEQFDQLLQALGSQTGSHDATLIFTGLLAFAGIIFVMWWVLNLKLAPLEKLSESLEKAIKDLNIEVTELSKKIWAPGQLEDKIELEVSKQIAEHVKNCPCRCGNNKE